jgi:hypothetical protein
MQTTDLVSAIAKGKGAKFASFKYTAKESGEVARHTLILGADSEVLYEKDIQALNDLMPSLDGIDKEAAVAILKSRQKSLQVGIGNNPDYTCAGVYVNPEGCKGVRVHVVTGALYVSGLQEHKTVLVPGTFKEVNSKPLTIAKRGIEKLLPSGRFRLFKLSNVTAAKLNGEVLEIETEPEVTA